MTIKVSVTLRSGNWQNKFTRQTFTHHTATVNDCSSAYVISVRTPVLTHFGCGPTAGTNGGELATCLAEPWSRTLTVTGLGDSVDHRLVADRRTLASDITAVSGSASKQIKHLVGRDLGGQIAWPMPIRYPENVTSNGNRPMWRNLPGLARLGRSATRISTCCPDIPRALVAGEGGCFIAHFCSTLPWR